MTRHLLTLLLVSCCCLLEARGSQIAEQVSKLDDPSIMDLVVKNGDAAVPDLIAALQGARPDLAAKALGLIKSKAAVSALLLISKTKDDELRATVTWAIVQCGGNESGTPLIALANDPYPAVRVAAINGLSNLQSAENDAALKRAVADSNSMVRMAAVDVIRRNHRADLFSSLAPLLAYKVVRVPEKKAEGSSEKPKLVDQVNWKEPNAQIRHAVICAVGETKAAEAIPPLIEALEREDSFNRQAIVKAIETIGPSAAGVCLGRIVPMVYDKDAFDNHMPILITNGTLAVIAGRLGDARCVSTLLSTLKIPRTELGKSKDVTELYIQTVQLLGKFKSDRAGRLLAELLKQSEIRQLTDAIQEAIRLIGRPAARPLAENMDDWRLAPIFLKLLREPELRTPKAEANLLKFLGLEADEVRLEATDTLGLYIYESILDEYDLPMLETMYLDPNGEVRACAKRWQDKITRKLEMGATHER